MDRVTPPAPAPQPPGTPLADWPAEQLHWALRWAALSDARRREIQQELARRG